VCIYVLDSWCNVHMKYHNTIPHLCILQPYFIGCITLRYKYMHYN